MEKKVVVATGMSLVFATTIVATHLQRCAAKERGVVIAVAVDASHGRREHLMRQRLLLSPEQQRLQLGLVCLLAIVGSARCCPTFLPLREQRVAEHATAGAAQLRL